MSQLLYISIVCFIACLIAKKYSDDTRSRDVGTQYGVVRGYLSENDDCFAFLGIPYAASPIGENRFKAPLPPPCWQGVFTANRTVNCPQNGKGNEDCLILNIFTPIHEYDANQLIPVLFYIHGGSFLIGSGQTKGVHPLIEQNVIVVTINYRLGALGFLCLGTEDAPGNAGLKDQLAALTWIHENIDNFGGDPSKITIYGMSAGAASVELHVLSNMSKGIINNAIVESAAATTVWAIDADPIKTAKDVAKYLKFPVTDNLTDLVSHYQNVPADVLSIVNNDYYNNLTGGTFGFVPCVERKLNEAFLTDDPYTILTKEKYKKIPMMFIFASFEGLFLRSEDYNTNQYKEKMRANFNDFVPDNLIFESNQTKNEVAKNIKQFYFKDKDIDDDIKTEYLNYFGDSLILHSLLNSVEIHAKGTPVYLMEFAYKGNLGSHEDFFKDINYAGHGDAVKHAILRKPILNTNDTMAVQRISTLIGNFVKFENPTPQTSQLFPVIWPRVLPPIISHYHVDKDIEVQTNPYWERKVFWDNIYTQYRRPLVKHVDHGKIRVETVNFIFEFVMKFLQLFNV